MKFDFFEDPSHGWLKVPIKLLHELEIENQISTYSYMKGDYAYLEEDSDAPKFLIAASKYKKRNLEISIKSHHTNRQSKIRNYDSYKLKNKPIITSVTYSMKLNAGIIVKCLKKDRNIFEQIKENIDDLTGMEIIAGSELNTIEFTFITDSIKKYDPKYNIKTWQKIAKIIENQIKEE